ncbi:MAG: translation initiation factor IF-6, partial [Promethearchaeota archaeon]
VPCIKLEISFKKLIGVMMVGNSNGLLLPNHINPYDEEHIIESMKDLDDLRIHVLKETKLNALGNLIAANNHGAFISERMPKECLRIIEDVLGVPTVRGNINSSHLVGTKIVVNEAGCLVSPLASDDDAESLQEIFKVRNIDFTTVCLGIESIRIGIIANSNGAAVGKSTTGPEMARISEILEI